MRSQDDIDTAPVLPKEGSHVEYVTVELDPGERVEIVLGPAEPMREPLLILACPRGSDVVSVEQVAAGPFVIEGTPCKIGTYRFGREIAERVTREAPLKILLFNGGPERTKIAASLVATEERPGAYEISKKDG